MYSMHRRTVLRLLGAGLAGLGAGCAGDEPAATPAPSQRHATATLTPGQRQATATPTSGTPTPPPVTPTPTATPTPREGTVTVDVGPGFFFRPASIRVRAGTTVRWVWRSDGHNVAVDDRPDDAAWRGYSAIADTGFAYEFTFTVQGTYRYVCEPHVRQGMAGRLTVV
jgi:plastocyanin